MSSQKKLTSKISNLQLFEFSINNSSPFPMWCWFRNYAEKDSQVTILHLKDNIYIKIRNKKGTQKRFLLWRTQISLDWIALSKHWRLFCYTSPPLSLLNKLTPKSWVANGVPILFQTLILEKLMLHQYFKQHFTHQKGVSNLPFKVQGCRPGNL